MPEEGFHYLSPLLPGQRLLQQLLLSHLFHPNVTIPVQKLDERRTSGLVVKKKHLERAGEQRDMFVLRNPLMN